MFRRYIMPILLLAGGLAAGIFLTKAGFNRVEELRKIERIPRTAVAALIPGEANIEGRVEMKPEQRALAGPKSGAACVYFEYRIEERKKDSEGKESWSTVHSSSGQMPFLLRDDSGSIAVQPDGGEIRFSPKKAAFQATEGKRRYTEDRIDPGDVVFVMGRAANIQGEWIVTFSGSGHYVPIISTRSEAEERGGFGPFATLFTVFGLLCLSLAMYGFTRLVGVQQVLGLACMVAVASFLTMFVQGVTMVRNDLRAATGKVSSEEQGRTAAIKAILDAQAIACDGDWDKLTAMLQVQGEKPDAAARRLISLHRINLVRSARRAEALIRSFPENIFAFFLGYKSPAVRELLPEEQEELAKSEKGFAPSRLSGTAAGVMSIIGLLLTIGVGYGAIFKLKVKRWIENLPTVKSTGVVCGMNEVKGKIVMPEGSEPLKGPLSGKNCVYYHYVIKEKRRSGKKTSWVTIHDEKQHVPYFYCEDADGFLLVNPEGAEVMAKSSVCKRKGNQEHTELLLPVGCHGYLLGCAMVNPYTHDSLILARGTDKSLPFLISDYKEGEIIQRMGDVAFFLFCLAMSAFSMAGIALSGLAGMFGAASYLNAAMMPVLFAMLFAVAMQYNDLIFLRQRCDASWANIDVALKKRFDLLPRLVEVAKGYLSHEKGLQEDLTKLRSTGRTLLPAKLQQALVAEAGLLQRLSGLVENYPELKGNEVLGQVMGQLSALETEVALMREGYNHAVETYNSRIGRFPDLLLARFARFSPREFFHTADTAPVAVKI